MIWSKHATPDNGLASMIENEAAAAPDNGSDDNGMTQAKGRGRPAVKNVDAQIAELAEKMAFLRKQKSAQEKKEHAELVQVIGTTIMAILGEDADPALTQKIAHCLRERVTRARQRALVDTWLASLTK